MILSQPPIFPGCHRGRLHVRAWSLSHRLPTLGRASSFHLQRAPWHDRARSTNTPAQRCNRRPDLRSALGAEARACARPICDRLMSTNAQACPRRPYHGCAPHSRATSLVAGRARRRQTGCGHAKSFMPVSADGGAQTESEPQPWCRPVNRSGERVVELRKRLQITLRWCSVVGCSRSDAEAGQPLLQILWPM